jgi:hypothetical protein
MVRDTAGHQNIDSLGYSRSSEFIIKGIPLAITVWSGIQLVTRIIDSLGYSSSSEFIIGETGGH